MTKGAWANIGTLSLLTLFLFVIDGLVDGIMRGYHPNAVEGHLGLRLIWFFAAGAVLSFLWTVCIWVVCSPRGRLKWLRWSWLAWIVFAIAPIPAYWINTDHRVVYYIGDQKYSIPWKYDPINGSKELGGEYFVVTVAYPDLQGTYSSDEKANLGKLTVSKGASLSSISSNPNIDELCEEESCRDFPGIANFNFQHDGFIYRVHYQGKSFSFENRAALQDFKHSMVELFDSFKAS